MADSSDESKDAEQPEASLQEADSKEAQRAQKRTLILESIGGGNLGTMELRVAWILNSYPEARDSDIKLQLSYWQEFENYDGGAVFPEDLFRRTRF